MQKDDIALIVHDTIVNFPHKIEEPIVLFLDKRRFSHFLDFMELKKHVSKTPCFVMETKGGNVMYFCVEIINALTKDFTLEKKKMFIEAVTLHELFHIWNHLRVRSGEEAVFSEEVVWNEMDKFYPKHNKILRSFKKK